MAEPNTAKDPWRKSDGVEMEMPCWSDQFLLVYSVILISFCTSEVDSTPSDLYSEIFTTVRWPIIQCVGVLSSYISSPRGLVHCTKGLRVEAESWLLKFQGFPEIKWNKKVFPFWLVLYREWFSEADSASSRSVSKFCVDLDIREKFHFLPKNIFSQRWGHGFFRRNLKSQGISFKVSIV